MPSGTRYVNARSSGRLRTTSANMARGIVSRGGAGWVTLSGALQPGPRFPEEVGGHPLQADGLLVPSAGFRGLALLARQVAQADQRAAAQDGEDRQVHHRLQHLLGLRVPPQEEGALPQAE